MAKRKATAKTTALIAVPKPHEIQLSADYGKLVAAEAFDDYQRNIHNGLKAMATRLMQDIKNAEHHIECAQLRLDWMRGKLKAIKNGRFFLSHDGQAVFLDEQYNRKGYNE